MTCSQVPFLRRVVARALHILQIPKTLVTSALIWPNAARAWAIGRGQSLYLETLTRWRCHVLGVDRKSSRTFRTCMYGAGEVLCSCHERNWTREEPPSTTRLWSSYGSQVQRAVISQRELCICAARCLRTGVRSRLV